MKKIVKSAIIYVVIIMLFSVISFAFTGFSKTTLSNYNGYTIVIDAGHGGRDGGSVGVGGTVEKEVNLKYALKLKDKLVKMGYKVILTRKDDDGLYSNLASNKKISDLNKRMDIIKKANPNLMVSIHMNSFSDRSAKGAMTYYRVDDGPSKMVGDYVQKSLKENCGARWEQAKTGDYYILNSSYYTSILVECGFLSNPDEEEMLNSSEYCEKIVNSIAIGIGLYFGFISEEV